MSSPTASNYVLGQSDHEYERLMFQARILRPYTEKFFRAAGLAPGMRVLDVGSGMGDVALLSADIVGPGGRVLGIDRDATALDNARRRTDEQGCSSWVEFQASDLDQFATKDQYDALVGRYVLLYQPDPSSTIRSLLRSVKLGGIIVFQSALGSLADDTVHISDVRLTPQERTCPAPPSMSAKCHCRHSPTTRI